MSTLLRSASRLWSVTTGSNALPANASSLVFWVRSANDLLLLPVTAFLAWELAANVYSAASAEARGWLRDSVRDDNVGARLDLQSALAMRRDEPGVLEDALVPVTLLVGATQLSSLPSLRQAELAHVARFELSLDPARLDANLATVEALGLDPERVGFKVEGSTDASLTLAQLARLSGLGGFVEPSGSGGRFAVRVGASDLLDTSELQLLEATRGLVSVKAEPTLLVRVTDSLDATLKELRGFMASSDVQMCVLELTSAEQASLTPATLALLRSAGDRIKIDAPGDDDGLTLLLPGQRALERTLASPSVLLLLSKLGIDHLGLAVEGGQALRISLPQWKLLDALGIQVDVDVPLGVRVNTAVDLRELLAKNVGTDVNHASLVVDDLAEVGLRAMQDLVRQGYGLSTSDAPALDVVRLEDTEINLFMLDAAEWMHLFEQAGVHRIDFGNPVTLSEQATRALLDSSLQAGAAQTVVGRLSFDSMPDEFFDHVAEWMQAKHMDAIEWVAPASPQASHSLGTSLAHFSAWALDSSVDLRMKGMTIGIPEYLLVQQSADWVQRVETHLGVQVVGITDSDIQVFPGH